MMEAGIRQRTVTAWNHVRAILALPFTNTVIMPAILMRVFDDARLGQMAPELEFLWIVLSMPLLLGGLTLVVRSISLFVRRGRGTLAPWDPTQVLITEDIYRCSRNPMKAGLFLVLIAECLLFRSTALIVWAATFMLVNAIYIRYSEEPGLERRFGAEYARYCREVPRWLGWRSVRARGRVPVERTS